MESMLTLVRYLWALPNTLIGLVFVPIVLATKGRMEIVDGVLELRGRVVATLLTRCVPIPGGAAAMTFGHIVVGRDRRALAATRAHERVHVRQCERWGPAFVPAYLLAAAWGALSGHGAYHGNYFERQAFQRCASSQRPPSCLPRLVLIGTIGAGSLLMSTAAAEQDLWPTDRWSIATPESQGMDSGTLAQMLEFARARQMPLHSVFVVRRGRVVLDASVYPYDGSLPHDVASATKSVTSVLIGIAIDKGYIRSVNERVQELLPAVPRGKIDPSKDRLTVEHLLTMTSGFECGWEPGEKELAAMRKSDDWAAYVLALPMRADPGMRYAYCSCNNHLLSAILSARTGESAFEFARKHLFAPLGITVANWPSDPKGRSHGWGDLHLQPSDLAKIAYLYSRRGRWNGSQVVSENWVRESIRPRVPVRDGVGYGYSWWINTTRQPFVFEAVGRGGQRAAVVPDKDLVVVFTGGGVNTDELAPFLFKAIQSDAPLPESESGTSHLRRAIDGAKRPPAASMPGPPPSVAHSISGRRYVMEPNPLNLRQVSLAFAAPDEASATLILDNRVLAFSIGLDGRDRFSQLAQEGLRVASRGEWVSPLEFVLHVDTVAGINHFTFRMRFHEQRVDVQVDEATGEVRNLQLRGQAASVPR